MSAGLHALIDQIPDAEVEPTAALLEAMRSHDRALVQALLAEEEPLEAEDAQALAEVDRIDTIAGEEARVSPRVDFCRNRGRIFRPQ